MSTNALPPQHDKNRSDSSAPSQQPNPATLDNSRVAHGNGDVAATAKRRSLRVVPTQELPSSESPSSVASANDAVAHRGVAPSMSKQQGTSEQRGMSKRNVQQQGTQQMTHVRASYDSLHKATPPQRSGRGSRGMPSPASSPVAPSPSVPSQAQQTRHSREQQETQAQHQARQARRLQRANQQPQSYGRSSRAQIAQIDAEASEGSSNTAQNRKNSRGFALQQGDRNNQVRGHVAPKNQRQARVRRENPNDTIQTENALENTQHSQRTSQHKNQRASLQEAQMSRQLQRQARASYKQQQRLSPEQAAQKVYKRRHGRRREGFLFLLLLLTLLGMVLWFTLNASLRYLDIQEVSLPNMVGRPIEQVEAELTRLGLELERYEEQTRAVAAHHVSSQSPIAGSRVRQGRRVVLGVNTPEQAVTLLPLVGLDQEDALATLEQLHLVAAQIDYVTDEEVPAGTVLLSEPESSSVLATGSAVHLTISRGPEAAKITMPQLVGLSVNEAERRVRALGVLQVDKVLAGVGSSKVVQHLPIAGEVVLAKAPVTLYYQTSNSNLVWIPDLTGKTMPQVYSDLGDAGLTINERWVQYIRDTSAPDGVVTQNPSAGWALRNSPVTLVVNRTSASYANSGQPSTPSFTGSPTGVGPVNNFVPFDPNRRLVDILAGTPTTPNTSIERPNIDSSVGPASNIPLLSNGNVNAPATLPSTTLPPATLPPATLPSTNFTPAPSPTSQVPSTTVQPNQVQPSQPTGLVPPSSLNTTGTPPNILQPLPPSRLPIPDSSGNLINPLPPSPNPLIPPASTPSVTLPPPPSAPVSSAPVSGAGTPRNIPVNFNPASYAFLQGRSFRYRLVAQDTQGERTLIDRQMQNGESISQLITVYGSTGQVELRTYIDDEYFQAWNP